MDGSIVHWYKAMASHAEPVQLRDPNLEIDPMLAKPGLELDVKSRIAVVI